ncbi:MAG: VWA domain-containing protein [Saprospiraceae bacterium]
MIKHFFSCLFLACLPAFQVPQAPAPKTANAKIQVALLLDTSNSMDGLIDQAKAQLWKMVNKLSNAQNQNQQVVMEIALYEYGNSGLEAGEGYIRMVQGFGMDLDGVSEQLFKLKTNGGDEYCGWVIKDAVNNLKWSKDADDLRIIVIAGNEPFDQGKVDYKESCELAASKDIIINTIHCGDYETGVRTHWKDGSVIGKGQYMNINTDEKVIHIPTPYDARILKCNELLNSTYIGYGSHGAQMKMRQEEQDMNAAEYGSANIAQRSTAKAKASYNNATWDLVDAYEADDEFVENLDKKDLPDEYKDLSKEELTSKIEKLKSERIALQKEILELEVKMEAFIAAEKAKMAGEASQTLDNVLIQAIVEQAEAKGFTF